MNIQQDIDLQSLNTMALPSRARFYAKATTVEEVKKALRWAKKNNQVVNVLGGGSNCLPPSNLKGLVLQPLLRGVELLKSDNRHVWVKAAAGENWHRLVQYCLARHYYGLENLAYIPGLVGAAPIQNIGAYGVELKDVFYSLEAVNKQTGEIEIFDSEACQFAYRESIFKGVLQNQYVIISVTLRLKTHAVINDHYPALKAALAGLRRSVITPELVAHTVTEIRRAKLPSPLQLPNSGSFFKNPVISNAIAEQLRGLYPDLAVYDIDREHKKIAAGWLIDKSGWKGREVFDVKVHDQQALIIVNPKKMPLENIMRLARSIQSNIRTRYGIELEQEPQVLS